MDNLQLKKLKMLRHGEIDNLFIGSQFDEKIIEQSLGVLNLSTGSIVANDPFCMYEIQAFEKSVPAGKYPVVLYIHNIDSDRRVGFAEIRFTENIPVSFELAYTKGQDINELEVDEFYGYGVDSGTGCFMDKATCDMLEEIMEGTEDGIIPELDEKFDKSYVETYSAVNYTLPCSDNNIVAFSSGFGDGGYPSFWTYDQSGELCSLITDFMTIYEEEDE